MATHNHNWEKEPLIFFPVLKIFSTLFSLRAKLLCVFKKQKEVQRTSKKYNK